MYPFKNFMILELLVDLTIAAEGNLEKLSIATKRYDFALELLKNGPAKSSWTSSFAAVGSSCFSNLCFGISDFKFSSLTVRACFSFLNNHGVNLRPP